MAALRISSKTAAYAVAGAGVAYSGYRLYSANSLPRTAYAESPASAKKMEWKGFTELKMQSAEMVNHNVKRITFALPDENTVSGISPVTSLLSQHTPDGAWIPVIRPYTPVSENDVPGTITFMVKRYPNGKGSGKMHSLVPGDTMKFKPLNEFEYKPNAHQSMLFIAGGSGITPIYQLTRAILKNPDDKTKISLVYANNTEQDILLKEEFEELERKYPDRFNKVFTVSKASSEGEGLFEKGYVTEDTIKKVWPGKQSGQKILVSGPPPMIEAIAGAKGGFGWTQGSVGGILQKMGYGKDDVHKF